MEKMQSQAEMTWPANSIASNNKIVEQFAVKKTELGVQPGLTIK